MARARPFDLSTLLNVAKAAEFLGDAWPNAMYVAHGPRARFGGLLKIPGLQSGRALIKAWKGRATVWPRLKTADEIQTVGARRLPGFHRKGHTLYFAPVEDEIPGVLPFLRRIERDLGLRRGDMTCEAIVSRRGAGTAPHFDADCTFNIQIEGRKRWRVEPNASIEAPHKAGMAGCPVHPEMASYVRTQYPGALSPAAQAFDARPGTVTFLPHGWWHATECVDDSFAIAFVVPGPKWYQLFADEIAAALVKHAAARRMSRIGPHARRDEAAAVLTHLRVIVDAMDVDALLKRWGGPPAFYFHKLAPRGGKSLRRLPDDLLALANWVAGGPDVFCTFDAMDAFPRADPSAVVRGLFTLVEAGVIELN